VEVSGVTLTVERVDYCASCSPDTVRVMAYGIGSYIPRDKVVRLVERRA
jgi:hypothetical protein